MVSAVLNICSIILVVQSAFGTAERDPVPRLMGTDDFKNFLETLAAEGLGVKAIQEMLNTNARYEKKQINGSAMITKLAKDLDKRYQDVIWGIWDLKISIEESLTNVTHGVNSSIPLCSCDPTQTQEMEYSSKYRQDIGTSESCVKLSTRLGETGGEIPEKDSPVLDVMKSNHGKSGVRWQYFGLKEGPTLLYPKRIEASCNDTFDPRLRPWFAMTKSPFPKDIVLLIDKSESMKGINIKHAIKAAETVLGTLSPKDRVGIVTFSNEAATPTGDSNTVGTCFFRNLADATPKTINILKEFLEDVTPVGVNKFKPAFETGFSLFPTTKDDENKNRDKLILLLTDSSPTNIDIVLDTIHAENQKLDNEVVIFVYAVGDNIDGNAKADLTAIAEQKGFDPAHGNVTSGSFVYVEDLDNLQFKMGVYYSAFTKDSMKDDVSITVPYNDWLGLGLVTSICYPVYAPADTFRGVVCGDVALASIFEDLLKANLGEYGYFFIIDKHGQPILHPLLPAPVTTTQAPVYLDIVELEQNYDVQKIIPKMRSENNGSVEITNYDYTISKGASQQDGSKTMRIGKVKYYWQQFSSENFTLCLMIPEQDGHIEIIQNSTASDFIYHRFDTNDSISFNNNLKFCSHHNHLALKDKSSVQLCGPAFQHPHSFYFKREDKRFLQTLDNYFAKGAIAQGEKIFKKNVREVVLLTGHADKVWTRNSSMSYNNYLLQRYIGTYNGVMRRFPGTAHKKGYKTMSQVWYKKAIANPEKFTLNHPFYDERSNDTFITMTTLLHIKSNDRSTSPFPMGVLGADVSISYIHQMVMEIFDVCEDKKYVCFIMDTSGFILYHEDYMGMKMKLTSNQMHVTIQEPLIAKALIEKKLLQQKKCRNVQDVKEHHVWEVNVASHKHSNFELLKIPNSNIHIGKRLQDLPRTMNCKCNQTKNSTVYFAGCGVERECYCPCTTYAKFDFCRSEFPRGDQSVLLCVPEGDEIVEYVDLPVKEPSNTLPMCYTTMCEKATTQSSCPSVIGCSWCYSGMETGESCVTSNKCKEKPVKGKNNFPLIIGVVMAVVVVAIIIILVATIIIKRRRQSEGSSTQTEAAVNMEPVLNDYGYQGFKCGDKAPKNDPSGINYANCTVQPRGQLPEMPAEAAAIPNTYITTFWLQNKKEEERESNTDTTQSLDNIHGLGDTQEITSNKDGENLNESGREANQNSGNINQDTKETPNSVMTNGYENYQDTNPNEDENEASQSQGNINENTKNPSNFITNDNNRDKDSNQNPESSDTTDKNKLEESLVKESSPDFSSDAQTDTGNQQPKTDNSRECYI